MVGLRGDEVFFFFKIIVFDFSKYILFDHFFHLDSGPFFFFFKFF